MKINKLAPAPTHHNPETNASMSDLANGLGKIAIVISHKTKAAAAHPKTTRSHMNEDLVAIETVITIDIMIPKIVSGSRLETELAKWRSEVRDDGRAS